MRRKGIALLLLLALCLGLCGGARALEAPALYEGYIVKLKPEAAAWVLSEEDGEDPGPYLAVDTLDEALEFPEELVEYIEPNYLVELFADPDQGAGDSPAAPNDPYYEDYQWSLQLIHAYEAACQGLTGRGVTVGFVDSGVNRSHEDLEAADISGVNFHSDGLGFDQDTYGHGTFAAGIVAAQTDNGLGLAGLAPGVTLRAYRVFDRKTASVLSVAKAITQAVSDGCQILNLSLGMATSSKTLQEAVSQALEAGVIVVAAVGNNGTDALQYPAAYPGVIGVGSVDRDLTVSSFSQRNESVDFTAPGGGVAGLDNETTDGYCLDLDSPANRGTSYAAPVITALAALALDYDASISPEGIFALLKASAIDLGETGYDASYGFGLPDTALLLEELERSYPIEYRPGEGAELPEDAPADYRMYAGADLPVPLRPGYWFTGWYEDEACQGPRLSCLPVGAAGDKVLYAGWLPEDRRPQTACLADYDSQGRMLSLEWLEEEDWASADLPREPGGSRKVFWLDGELRPTLAAR